MKKLFSFLLVALMLLSPFAICVNAESVTEQAIDTSNTTSESKLTPDLQEYLAGIEDDEYVPVYIWLNDYGEDMLYEVLSKRVGKTVTANTEEAYIQDKIKVKEELLSKGLEALAKTDEYKLQAMSTGTIDIRNLTGDIFKLQASLSDIMTDEEINTCIESNMTSTEIITLSERNQFLSDYRNSRKIVNTAVNTTFYNSLDLDECRNVYLDPALPHITMECKKSYIDDIEGMSIVNDIGYKHEIVYTNYETADVSNSDASTASSVATYPMTNSYPYTGAGIRVGVIEPNADANQDGEADVYYRANVHLKNKIIIHNIPEDKKSQNYYSEHATSVLSILGGNEASVNSITYQGIASQASLYYTNTGVYSIQNDISAALNWMICESNVSVVNVSFGAYTTTEIKDGKETYIYRYDEKSKVIDYYVNGFRAVVVVAAGNLSYKKEDGAYVEDENGDLIKINDCDIGNTALSYNCIAVGNNTFNVDENGNIEMNNGSSYKEDSYLTNRPDLVAVGTSVEMADEISIKTEDGTSLLQYTKIIGSGTSFAAPQVTGAVALMMQANPNLIGKPDTVKAILLNSADEEAISPESNDGVEANGIITEEPTIYNTSKIQSSTGTLREKSGAGLLNIEAAIRMANSNLYYDFTMGETSSTVETETYYFNAGTTIEFGLAYEKATDDILTEFNINDLDIRILDSNNDIVFASADYINNVEMFKCTFAASGEYKFNIFCWHAEEPINATFILSCSCKDKLLSHGSYQVTQHTVSCDTTNGCGFTCYEKHRVASVTKSFGYGSTATFNVYYLFEKNNDQNRSFDYYTISIDNLTSTQGTFWEVRGAGLTTTTTTTGEIRTHSFEAVIELSGGTPVFPTTSVVITIDYYDKTVLIQ